MTTTSPEPAAEGTRMWRTPEIEPLVVPPEERSRNVVDLVHRSVERNGDREALRWKLAKAKRAEGSDESPWVSRTYREMWDWVTRL